MEKEYFKIAFAQLKLNLDYDETREYLIADNSYFEQMDKIVDYLSNTDLDVLVFPEMSYHEKYHDYFLKYSLNKLIVFGSVYDNNTNYTVVYHKGKKYLIKKLFNSAVEPSIRFNENISTSEFMKKYLNQHTFVLHHKKFIVLNCAEYYKVAYFIARNCRLSKNLFAFLVPCANNNSDVFIAESIAIHNHNDNIYSFVVNSSSYYKGEKYSYGESYIFGQNSKFEKINSNVNKLNHSSNICLLDDEAYFVEGMFLFGESSKYYRSDNYKHTPLNLKIYKLGDKKL